MATARKGTKLWTMRDGARIRICDMTDSHLRNAIALIERYATARYDNDLADAAIFAEMFDGESMAAYYAEQNFDRVNAGAPCPEAASPLYTALCDERDRRGLS